MDAGGAPWYRDAAARSLILRRYLPWLAGLSLVWEIAQLPLCTIWSDGRPVYIAFAVLHCTAGDVLIGLAALALALIITQAPSLAPWRRDWPVPASSRVAGPAACPLPSPPAGGRPLPVGNRS